jgi:chemotaxis protein CheZ
MSGAAQATSHNDDSPELEALFDSIIAASRPAPEKPAEGDDVICQIGQLTRKLHDAMRGLGYDRLVENAAQAIPDARQRLDYVANMTEQAAMRALNAIEAAKPVQEKLEADAGELARQWDRLFDKQLSIEQFRELAGRTRAFLHAVPQQTGATSSHLTEIMMAQDFQDLTGQVIKKITEVAQDMEQQLLKVLVENAPVERRVAAQSAGLLNGPVTDPRSRHDVVTNQLQVDELLDSLGF